MRSSRWSWLLPLLAAPWSLEGCGGAGPSSGTDLVARGTITHATPAGPRPLIVVNGIEFLLPPEASIVVSGRPARPADLAVGMPAEVAGYLADGSTGVATEVYYTDVLHGPVSFASLFTDPRTREVVVLGQSVMAVSGATRFDDLTGVGGFGFDSVGFGDVVEVNGLRDSLGVVRATRIARTGFLDPANPGATRCHASGPASLLPHPDRFQIEALLVHHGPATQWLGFAAGGLADRMTVSVIGPLRRLTPPYLAEVDAAVVEQLHPALPVAVAMASVEGYVADLAPAGPTFALGGQRVDASSARFEPKDLASRLAPDLRVIARGPIEAAVLVAERVTEVAP